MLSKQKNIENATRALPMKKHQLREEAEEWLNTLARTVFRT